MSLAYTKQNFQDWFTQQWVILWGTKIVPSENSWLMGPFGDVGAISDEFILELAKTENLIVERNCQSHGLIAPFSKLKLSEFDLNKLSTDVIDFYEHTALYNLKLEVDWNPLFKYFGNLVNKLFSQRIKQLNIPTESSTNNNGLTSEIITLRDSISNEIKYTIWFRTFESTGKVVYSGIYGTCTLANGATCVKAVFPLPKGNATVIMQPLVGDNGELILNASGKRFGDAGFYFLLKDQKGDFWAQYISSFKDQLKVKSTNNIIQAEQKLTLWKLRVLTFQYQISKK